MDAIISYVPANMVHWNDCRKISCQKSNDMTFFKFEQIYQNGTLDLRKLFQPGGSGSDESSQKSGSRSPTVRILLEFNTVTAQTEFSCQLARPPTPPPSGNMISKLL